MHTFHIGRNDGGQRADKFLIKACPKLPKSLLYKTFRKKDVKCNNKRISADTFLTEGDVLEVYLPEDCFAKKEPAKNTIQLPPPDIFFENEDIAILKKPVNLPVHADDKGSTDTLQMRFLQHMMRSEQYQRDTEQSFSPALCNRLDRNTEGFVIGAKNARALRTINAMIREGRIQKQYLCVVCGKPPKQCDTVIAYHRREAGKKAEISAQPKEGFQKIQTGYEVLDTRNQFSLLLVTLYTGKTHQIRAQMAALHCPILGDRKYGNEKINAVHAEAHQLLAACRLTFQPTENDIQLEQPHFSYIPEFCKRYGFVL